MTFAAVLKDSDDVCSRPLLRNDSNSVYRMW